LKARNSALIGPAIAARDAYEDSLAASRGFATGINGMKAAPAALSAVGFALRQLGKPYEWAAEGPWTYDCSGLVLAAYQSVGVNLPRVSRYQYHAGTPVLASQLLPGDLLFFSTDRSDWRKIHHVAMYIGGGRMIHAPTFGDVVRIAPIWWSEFFAATRIMPAVAGTGSTTPPPVTTRPPSTTTQPPATTTQPPATTTQPPTTPPTIPPPTTTVPPTTTTTPAPQETTTTTTTEPPQETTTTPTEPPQETTTTTEPPQETSTATAEPEQTTIAASLPPAVTGASTGEVRRHRRRRRFF
jgi:hypothetical protein